MSQSDSILLKALDNIIKFLLKTVVDYTNEEVKKKIFYLNHLIEEERTSIFEKADQLLEFSQQLIDKKENISENSNKEQLSLENYDNYNEILTISHTPFLSQIETESYFSKPYIKSSHNSSENIFEPISDPINIFGEQTKTIETKKKSNLEDLIIAIKETKEEFNINDHYLLRHMKEALSSPSNKKSSNDNKKNYYVKTNPSNIEEKSFSKELESNSLTNQNNTNKIFQKTKQPICNMKINNPEKTFILKNILPNPFMKKIQVMPECNQILEKPRHSRQMSVHVPCFSRPYYSPFSRNNMNNFNYIKY